MVATGDATLGVVTAEFDGSLHLISASLTLHSSSGMYVASGATLLSEGISSLRTSFLELRSGATLRTRSSDTADSPSILSIYGSITAAQGSDIILDIAELTA